MDYLAAPSKDTERAMTAARFFAPIEDARAVYRGLVVVGHRESARAGEMFWALPGRDRADSTTLKSRDPGFQILVQPSAEFLRERQSRLGEVQQ